MRIENAGITEVFFAAAREAQWVAEAAEAKLADLLSAQATSGRAWTVAGGALSLSDRIRATYREWSRQVQARVLSLALDEAVLGHIVAMPRLAQRSRNAVHDPKEDSYAQTSSPERPHAGVCYAPLAGRRLRRLHATGADRYPDPNDTVVLRWVIATATAAMDRPLPAVRPPSIRACVLAHA